MMKLPRDSVLERGGKAQRRHRFRRVCDPLFPRLPLLLIAALTITPASAHDRHANAAMHQDVHVLIAKDHVEVTFKIETNEEGMLVEAIAMDANGDGKLSPDEQSSYFAQLDARLREGLQISVNDEDVLLAASAQVDLSPPAQKTFHFQGDLSPGTFYPATLEVHNDNFLDWPGKTKLEVEPGEKCALNLAQQSACDVIGAILRSPHGIVENGLPVRRAVDWNRWARIRLLTAQTSMAVVAVTLLTLACLVMLVGRPSIIRRVVALGLIAASFIAAGFAIASWREPFPSPDAWRTEFRDFHASLSAVLASYHRDRNAASLNSLCIQDVADRLTQATRVADPLDEKSGVFELRRVRPLSTTLRETPKSVLNRILRVHHEWRAIGVMRHQGHPHERIRDFSCDYTLRITDHGFQLIDCSDWHQLPDEPIE